MGNSGKKATLEDVAFDMKFAAKQMNRQSDKLQGMEAQERKKIMTVSLSTFLTFPLSRL